ncbi:MAG: phage holin family protein [Faecalicatena sp.]|uniref:phage holin family protein n=1 Tax=Faecalicatena sp. TaxID=2005360 RepID=UPI002589533F|nr:phage holin family protein [Faecalicatena sp.]MCI6467437.1 phage holin family protein [Faecalicatena sp.]MDY5618135.1 phage holin family protein [Lachnospiraceae bacterium]
MDLSFLTNYINPLILGICLMVGYVIKEAVPKLPNRYIPLSALMMGTIIAIVIAYPGINAEVILGGMISGLASTGLYEMIRNLLNKDRKKK